MPQCTATVIAVAFILLAVGAVIGLLVLLYDWLAPLISRTTHGVSLPDSIGDLVSRLRRRRSRDDEDGDDDDDDELDDEAAALLSILPAASIVVDDSDDVVRANPAAYRLGIVNDDVIVDSRVLDAVRKVREHGGKTSLEITTSTPKRFALPEPVDTEEDLKTSTVSRPNWLKLVIGRIDEQFVVVLIDDISESVRFSQMRDDFVTNVSEMIIRPSEDLQRLADVLEHGGMSPEQVAQAARDVRRSSAYVDHMVKNLLLLIKAQGDAPNAQSAVLDVREQVEVAVNELLPQARQRGITVSITGKGEPKVRGNATAIRAAIGKLVDNAIEYSPDNANVSVLIETTRDTKDALVRVVDRGTGIPLKEQPRIFERFYRGANQNERTQSGVGLGLAIVKHVAIMHHGNVQVWSRPGQGSTFSLVLPLVPESAEEAGEISRRRADGNRDGENAPTQAMRNQSTRHTSR